MIQELSVAILPIMLAITVHEAAHGFVADRLGDKTARMAGRVTLNPLKHIDPLGTVILPLVMYALSGFMFGWAKPVPVNWRNLHHPRRDTALVAIAGPAANFIMILGWAILAAVSVALVDSSPWIAVPLFHMAKYGILINAILMALNLLPILPLDGGRVLNSLLPPSWSQMYSKSEPWGLLILVALLVSGGLAYILMPMVAWLQYFAAQVVGMLQ
ncbi:MAG: site-2 protease family protein [Chromatiales bacterium]|jgi:Zn-dependent protease